MDGCVLFMLKDILRL